MTTTYRKIEIVQAFGSAFYIKRPRSGALYACKSFEDAKLEIDRLILNNDI